MENRNTFIAIALMLLVWVAYTIMFPAPQSPLVQPPAPVVSTPTTPAPSVPPASALAPSQLSTIPSTAQAPLREIVVETELYRAVFASTGAKLKELRLKQYREAASSTAAPLNLVTTGDGGTLLLSGETDFAISADARFQLRETSDTYRIKGDEKQSLQFFLSLPSGVTVVKEYTLSGNSYAIDLALTAQNTTTVAKQGRLALVLNEATDKINDGSSTDFSGAETLLDQKLRSDKVASFDKGPKEYTGITWSAFKSKYFLRAVVPLDNLTEKVVIRKSGLLLEQRFVSAPQTLNPGEAKGGRYTLFFGPLEMETLKSTGHSLDQAVDLGWFAVLARPLFGVLKFFNTFVGNYGWSIIILTVIIKLLFWPLTNKSYASMKAMQKLQPEMQKIREKFKNDRDRMNLEIMNLYKNNRVNPMGGCLPMLVQMPIFFALYQVLMNMIELRHAPFMLWITDLSAKDPYYVTPLIMGATMFLQQKMTPSQLDPIQQKIFLIMPVVFTFLFLTFPSGLVVYWLVNNVLSIAQQYLINRQPD